MSYFGLQVLYRSLLDLDHCPSRCILSIKKSNHFDCVDYFEYVIGRDDRLEGDC
jgi:hypothetical protein